MKLALCNEVLQPLPFDAAMRTGRARIGYAGLELAPFTLADDPQTLDAAAAQRATRPPRRATAWPSPACTGCWSNPRACRWSARTTPLRARTLDLLRRLIDFAAACGAAGAGARLAQAAFAASRPERGRCHRAR